MRLNDSLRALSDSIFLVAGFFSLFQLFGVYLLSVSTGDFPSSASTILNITHSEGLASDFSNLAIEATENGSAFRPNFTIASYEPGQWALVNVSGVTSAASISIFAENPQGQAPAGTAQNEPESISGTQQNLGGAASSENITAENGTTGQSLPTGNTTSENETTQQNLSSTENKAATPELQPEDQTALQNGTAGLDVLPENATSEENGTSEQSLPSSGGKSPQQNQSPPGLSVLTTLKIDYFGSLLPDFSNLKLQITSGGYTLDSQFEIVEAQQGNFAIVKFLAPEGDYSINLLFSNTTATGQPSGASNASEAGRHMLNVTYFDGLEPDFSNLIIQFVSQDGTSENINHSVLSFSPSEWASVELERSAYQGELVNILAVPMQLPADEIQLEALAASGNYSIGWYYYDGSKMVSAGQGTASSGWQWYFYNGTDFIEWDYSQAYWTEPANTSLNGSNRTNNSISALNETPAVQLLPEKQFPSLIAEHIAGAHISNRKGKDSFVFEKPAPGDVGAQHILVQNSSAYDFGTKDFSLSAWFRTSEENTGTIIYRGSVFEGKGYELRMNVEGTILFAIGDSSQTAQVETLASFNDGNWHHVVAERQGGRLRVFVDGNLEASEEGPEMDISNSGVTVVGAYIGFGIASQFAGEISDPQIWNKALGENQIRAIWEKER
ncbi:MAG: LamG domain-containing protein [Candidatus Anstonellaceae archaeon]